MPLVEGAPPAARTPWSWTRTLGAAALWLTSCTVLGVLATGISGGHGSIVFAILGTAAGACGAVAHTALLTSKRYRALPRLKRSLLLWGACLALLAALALTVVATSDRPTVEAIVEYMNFLAIFSAVPVLLVAGAAVVLAESAA